MLAIKQTLYRTSDEGEAPIVGSLMRAAEAGKEIVALVEVTARGDEEANIAWARTLEKAGVHVVHGVVGLKTHAKTVLVVRREGETIRRYCHVGTGNYNPETATSYEDVGLLSADPELTGDVADLFNGLTGYAIAAEYRKILVAPGTLRPRLLELIREEAAAKDGRIVMKMNSLVDTEMIEALEDAAAAGAEIDLIVRGICCLRPGAKGRSGDPGALDRRHVSRALAHLLLRKRSSRRPLLDRLRRPDAAEPRPPGRVCHARDRSCADGAARGDPGGEPGGRRARLGARAGGLDEGPDQGRHRHARASPGARRSAGAARRVDGRRTRRRGLRRARGEAACGDIVPPARPGWAGGGRTEASLVDVSEELVRAAGGLVWRSAADGGVEIVLVHRSAYDDWAFPKGKLNAGETEAEAALREVEEETGLRCRLGRELGTTAYRDSRGRPKTVRYWEMTPVGGVLAAANEIDDARWIGLAEAPDALTYPRDRELLGKLGARPQS